jgi:16S rRNA (uracil1498-N3)-methyltransferase
LLAADESQHALKVLRMEPGSDLVLTDGLGGVAEGSIARISSGRVVARVAKRVRRPRFDPELSVYQGAPKGAKADEVVERLAELGVADITLFSSERSVVRWDSTKVTRLKERWQARARAAAIRSHNPHAAEIRGVLGWQRLLAAVASEPCAFVLSPRAPGGLKEEVPVGAARVALVVGPEGGLSEPEVTQLEHIGGRPVTLGPVVLRTENAGAAAVAALLWHFGRMG